MTPILYDRHLQDRHGPILTRGDLDAAEAEHALECRYEVRDRDGGSWGVWNAYLQRWESNAFGMDAMGETDARHLAADLLVDLT